MRGIGRHVPPFNIQPEPKDNTSEYVQVQVALYYAGGRLIHTEIAREIAAWYQAPSVLGHPFTLFASTGTIDEDLLYSIRTELMKAANVSEMDRDTLYALHAYVLAASAQ